MALTSHRWQPADPDALQVSSTCACPAYLSSTSAQASSCSNVLRLILVALLGATSQPLRNSRKRNTKMLYQQTSRALLRSAALRAPLATSSRALSTSTLVRAPGENKVPVPTSPTHSSRMSPKTGDEPSHPGYVPGGTPPSSKDPMEMDGVSSSAKPASMNENASTVAGPPHPGTKEMATGAKK